MRDHNSGYPGRDRWCRLLPQHEESNDNSALQLGHPPLNALLSPSQIVNSLELLLADLLNVHLVRSL